MAPFATRTLHKSPYAAISPTLSQHSQSGQKVMITGGASGIGFAIARAFAQARAAKIIILGRRVTALSCAATRIAEEVPAFTGEVKTAQCDIADTSSVAALWDELESSGTVIDVLILNVASDGPRGEILQARIGEVWAAYETNVRANFDLTQRFFNHIDKAPNGKKKSLLNISTGLIHKFRMDLDAGVYSASKNAFMALLHHIAIQTPVEKVQILSFHPGRIFTEAAERGGYNEKDYNWDDENLPGQFSVWATSSAASFLHGRFVHAEWDVDELQSLEVKARLEQDDGFLEVGVNGL